MHEIWEDVKGFEGLYRISNHGRFKSFKKNKRGYVMSNTNKNGWYFTVNLFKDGMRSTRRIHRLVAEHFIDNPENKPEINHIDGNKQNNHFSNLEWVTRKENMNHCAVIHPNLFEGLNKYNKFTRPKTILQYSLDGKFIAEYPNAKLASETTGICARNILQVADKTEYRPGLTRKQAGGFVWEFKK